MARHKPAAPKPPQPVPAESAAPPIAIRPADPQRSTDPETVEAARPIGSGPIVQPYVDERKVRRLQEDHPPGQPLTVQRAVRSAAADPALPAPAAPAVSIDRAAALSAPVGAAGSEIGESLKALVESAYLALREAGRGTGEQIRLEAERVGEDLLTLALIEAEIALAIGDGEETVKRRERLERLRSIAEQALTARLRSLRATAPFALHMQTRRALVAAADTALRAARLILAAKLGYPVPVLPPPLVLD